MVSPVWYNIRRVGVAKYELSGEHDVDVSWMHEVRGHDSQGEIVGRILPRFAVDQWDREAYQELMTNEDAVKGLTRIIIDQIELFSSLENAESRKYDYDGIVMELAFPQYFEAFLTYLSDKIHALSGEKRVVVVIPPNIPQYPSAEVPLFVALLTLDVIQSLYSRGLFCPHDIRLQRKRPIRHSECSNRLGRRPVCPQLSIATNVE